jgi:hypothetical protein
MKFGTLVRGELAQATLNIRWAEAVEKLRRLLPVGRRDGRFVPGV